ncbi:MAG: RNA polymerase factor sigma-54 [Candidatus Neomarinimicrobiota bacterium]
MQLSQSQIQRLSQELRLTPQQILQSTILQLTTLALEARVTQELEQNPVLEEVEPEYPEESTEPVSDKEPNEKDEINWEDILPQNDDYEPKQEYDHNVKQGRYVQPSPRGLVDHLFEQIKLMNFDEIDQKIASEIIWNIDDRGYLMVPIENIAYGLGTPEQKALNVLKQVQRFDPPGIGARDLNECLLIQLKQIPNSEDAAVIVRDFFDDFANKRFAVIMKTLGWNQERMHTASELIVRLNPKPGASLTSPEPRYIVPDLIVEKIDGEFIVEVNDSRVPELRISSSYMDMVANGSSTTAEAKAYLKKKIDSAKWFIQAIQQRRMTMIRVVKAIIAKQRNFFEDTQKPLKPMILKDIAEEINMDISTISRVTSGKYVQLTSGIYELKFFFNEGMKDEDGEEISTRIVKEKLKEIVEAENKQRPYSDDQLAKLLKKEGFSVARRTVAKYREQHKISVARLRRNI